MSFTDFRAGLQNVNDYIDARHHITGTAAGGGNAAFVVGVAQYSFTLRELLCGVLSGNGIKLPNIQIALNVNIDALLNIPNLQNELADALSQLQNALQQFMDHTRIDDILGRLNNIVSEAQQVANLLNFCASPIDPVAIPNMLENSFGSFLGQGKGIVDRIGTNPNPCAIVNGDGTFSPTFTGGILGIISDNFQDVVNGTLDSSVIQSIASESESIFLTVRDLIDRERNVNGAYNRGGSQFATPDPNCYREVGVLHNPFSSTIRDNARITSSLKALYDNLGGYPVRYQVPGSPDSDPEYIEYPNIFHVLLDPEFIEILEREDDPRPNIENRTPVFDYCGNIIGYTTSLSQGTKETSKGSVPTIPNSPGYAAGGLATTEEPTDTPSSLNSTTTTIITNAGGSNVYIVNSLSAQLALDTNTNDIVVRSDILTIFVRKDVSRFNSGTISDYQQGSVTFTAFGNSINNLQGEGFIIKSGDGAFVRIFEGTADEVVVFNPGGVTGNVRYGLAENTRIPGRAAIKIPAGNTTERPAGEVGKLRYNTNINRVEAYFSNTNNWQQFATLDDLSTSGVDLLNIGVGAEIFKQRNTANQFELRKINSTGAITITQNSNDITVGESLTATNIGTGLAVFNQRNNNNFEFKTVTSTNNITVTSTADTINVSGDPRIQYTTVSTNTNTVTNVSGFPALPSNATWFFTVTALAGDSGTTRRAWKLEGMVQDSSGTQSIIGSVVKTDYQRNTGDIGILEPWQPNKAYVSGDKVEYDLIEYTANNNVQDFTSPDQNSNWTATYVGWNVSAVADGSNPFVIKIRGDNNPVNWSLKFEYIQL
jgi:hypothetical protein